MTAVTINYSKRKLGFILLMLAMTFMIPFGFYFLMSGVGELVFGYLFLGCMSLTAVILSIAIVRKFMSKEPALELSEAGIRSNVTEFSEKFLPLGDISEAVVKMNSKGQKILHVKIKKVALGSHTELFVNSRLFKAEPAMRIWHQLLDDSVENIASTINQYIQNSQNNYRNSAA